MAHEIVFAPEAQADLTDLYDYIAGHGGADRALGFVGRIEAACLSLAEFPERGTRYDDIRPGLRVIGLERRVTIAFHVGSRRVTIDRILYGGCDLGTALEDA